MTTAALLAVSDAVAETDVLRLETASVCFASAHTAKPHNLVVGSVFWLPFSLGQFPILSVGVTV